LCRLQVGARPKPSAIPLHRWADTGLELPGAATHVFSTKERERLILPATPPRQAAYLHHRRGFQSRGRARE
jgi:hypothetical protein